MSEEECERQDGAVGQGGDEEPEEAPLEEAYEFDAPKFYDFEAEYLST